MNPWLPIRIGLIALVWAGGLKPGSAADRTPVDEAWSSVRKKVTHDHGKLVRRFSEWKAALLRHQQRLEKGPSKAIEVALLFKKALDEIWISQLETKSAQLKDLLATTSKYEKSKIEKAFKLSRQVTGQLEKLRAILIDDLQVARFRRERKELQVFLNTLEKLIAVQKTVRSETDAGTAKWKRLLRSQDDLTRGSSQLARMIGRRQQGVAKLLHDAAGHQKQAEECLAREEKKKALRKQNQALHQLTAAKTKFTASLGQKREEEVDYLGKVLVHRCRHMLNMQRPIRAATVVIHRAINDSKAKKASQADREAAARLAGKQKELIAEANRAIAMVEAEGSAIAFAEVFKQVRTDMRNVQKLLSATQVGKETQVIEQDIVETLEDMVKALTTARKNRKGKGFADIPIQKEKPSKEMICMINRLEQIMEDYQSQVESEIDSVLQEPLIRPLAEGSPSP